MNSRKWPESCGRRKELRLTWRTRRRNERLSKPLHKEALQLTLKIP